jgi:hypothetical protein
VKTPWFGLDDAPLQHLQTGGLIAETDDHASHPLSFRIRVADVRIRLYKLGPYAYRWWGDMRSSGPKGRADFGSLFGFAVSRHRTGQIRATAKQHAIW